MQHFIFIRIDKKHIKLNFDEIIYIEAVNNYVRIVTQKKKYLILKKIKEIESILCPEYFCRIHRSYIISFQFLVAFDHTCVYLENNSTLPLSKFYLPILQQHISILNKDQTIVFQL